MSQQQRLGRLELAEQEREVYREAEGLSEELGVPAHELVRQFWEMAKRVERWGMDAALRWIAQEYGVSEDEVRTRYEAGLAEQERRRRC
jgi:hypothetical protein